MNWDRINFDRMEQRFLDPDDDIRDSIPLIYYRRRKEQKCKQGSEVLPNTQLPNTQEK